MTTTDDSTNLWKAFAAGPLNVSGNLAQGQLGELATIIQEQARRAGVASIDYAWADPAKANPLLMGSALRFGFASRAANPSWDAGILIAIQACEREGMDARKLLRGML